MQDNTSPEERLLRLIRKEPKKTSSDDKRIAKDLKTSQPEGESQGIPVLKKHFSFNLINRALLVILLILGIYLLADFIISTPKRIEKRILGFGEAKGPALEIAVETSSSVEPVSHYTQAVKSKNLFTAPGPQVKQERPSPSFLEMLSKLKLQGIISGANPQAVIEDTKTKQVYFLAPGEFIGDIQLKEILPGKVKLNYYGQEAELTL